MALICDVCRTRPATARVAFMVEGQQRIIDVCSEDFFKLQSGNQQVIQQLAHSTGYDSYAKQLVKHSAEVAAEYGQHQIASEHMLSALASDSSAKEMWEILGIRPADLQGFLRMNIIQEPYYNGSVELSEQSKIILKNAHKIAEENETVAGPEHILAALLLEEGTAQRTLERFGVTEEALQNLIQQSETQNEESQGSLLEKYSRDLTKLAAEKKLDPVIGRDQEIESVIEVLARRTKNNPVLVGEPGVGKTAIVEGLATLIHTGKVPEQLKNKRVLEVSLTSVLSGSRFRGEFEERIEGILKEVKKNKAKFILFIDEIHTVVGAGSGEGSLDAANILKPALARGEVNLIGATTHDEYRKYIEKDAALERRFQPISVNEPSLQDSMQIIAALKPRYEEHHKVKISKEAVKAAVELSDRYVTQRFLPDKAIDLIDQASSRVRIKNGEKVDLVVTDQHIAEVLAKITGIPVTEVTQEEKERLLGLEERLHARVIGQDEAVRAVANAVRISRAGLNAAHSPIATFLFLGPTGVGKTELSKALAADMFGSENALTRIDMSEYMERHSVARLIGSPPGYVGHEEGGQLTEAARRHPYGVILLDEIEKAHPEVANVLLQLFDDGRLTDGKGRVVDFSNTIIIATSNLGSTQKAQAKIGFQASEEETESAKKSALGVLSQHFRPEFINRIDEIIVFHPLDQKHIEQIVCLELETLAKRVKTQDHTLTWTSAVTTHLAEKGFSAEFGARELKRVIKSEIENNLAKALLEKKFKKKITLDYQREVIVMK